MAAPRKKPIRSEDICFWCGQLRKLTRDHVPPQGLFPSRVSASLPAVVACAECNRDWEKNSEYFRDFLMVGSLSKSTHPDLKEIREAYERARQHRIDRGKIPTLFRGVPVTAQSPAGIISIATLHQIDLMRIGDVIARTVGVIHRLHHKRLLAYKGSGYRALINDVLPSSPDYEKALSLLRNGNTRYADGLLKWCDFKAQEDANVQEWLISFYDEAIFHYGTRPEADLMPISFIFNRPFGSVTEVRPMRHLIF